MSHSPQVSICIPSYNHARYLPQTIESALSQTYRNIEIVIVDDGSTDDSLQIAESYAAKYPEFIRVFTHPDHRNLGISATVNLGFLKSRGIYYSGLPSDDILYPDKIERQVAFLENNPIVGWVYGFADYINEYGERLLGRCGTDITQDPNPIERLIQGNAIAGATVLARRKCVEQVGLHDETLVYSDWEYWVRFLAQWKVGFLKRSLVMFRQHTYNTSVGVEASVSVIRALEVMNALRRKAPLIGGALTNLRTLALIDLQRTYYLFCTGDVKKASESLRSAFEIDPTLSHDAGYFARWLRERLYEAIYTFEPGASERGFVSWILQHLPPAVEASFVRRMIGAKCAQAAFEHYKTDLPVARRMVLKCLKYDPRWLKDRSLLLIFMKSLIGLK